MKYYVRYEFDRWKPHFGNGYKNKFNITVEAEDRDDALKKARESLKQQGHDKFFLVDCVRLKEPK